MEVLKRRIALAALVALCLAPSAPGAALASISRSVAAPSAAAPSGDELYGFATVLRYAGCALGIAGATTGFGIAGAVIGCARLVYDIYY